MILLKLVKLQLKLLKMVYLKEIVLFIMISLKIPIHILQIVMILIIILITIV